ncbi:MAG: 50S ribosomal protein L35 [Planctomycetota bacterium]
MPKMKTRKALAKRFKKTATGKLLHWKAGRRHLMSGKSAKRRRRLRKTSRVFRPQEMALLKGLPSH